jgi:hypothetical protein
MNHEKIYKYNVKNMVMDKFGIIETDLHQQMAYCSPTTLSNDLVLSTYTAYAYVEYLYMYQPHNNW